jgi:hypothetical protein
LIIERAHAVSADKSPAQRFTSGQWQRFYAQCERIGQAFNCEILSFAWPERTTRNARIYAYGCAEKAKKDSGTHDVIAMRAFHEARPHLKLMRLDKPRHRTPAVIREAVNKHKEEMSFELLRLKSRKYPKDHPWMDQCSKAIKDLAPQMTETQRDILGIAFNKRNPKKLNASWNKMKVVTLWALTHNMDGSVRTDNRHRPISRQYLKTIINTSPYRERHCGVHRANIMNDARSSFVAQKLGMKKPKLDQLFAPDKMGDFIKARNEFDKEWLTLAKVFRDYKS